MVALSNPAFTGFCRFAKEHEAKITAPEAVFFDWVRETLGKKAVHGAPSDWPTPKQRYRRMMRERR